MNSDERMAQAHLYAVKLANAAHEAAGTNPEKWDAYHFTYLKSIDEWYAKFEQDAVDKTAAELLGRQP